MDVQRTKSTKKWMSIIQMKAAARSSSRNYHWLQNLRRVWLIKKGLEIWLTPTVFIQFGRESSPTGRALDSRVERVERVWRSRRRRRRRSCRWRGRSSLSTPSTLFPSPLGFFFLKRFNPLLGWRIFQMLRSNCSFDVHLTSSLGWIFFGVFQSTPEPLSVNVSN